MTKKLNLAILLSLASTYAVLAQESPSPTPTPTPSPSPTLSPARSVRISFVPPPLEGTISLGIYDNNSELVRVLHQEAEPNEFTIGADALVTQWDGKNDDGEDLPAGKYHARGYLVGSLRVEDLNQAAASPPENNSNASVKVNLMANPLANDKPTPVELGTGFDNDGSYLKTNDGLRLFTISKSPNLSRVSFIRKGDKSVDVWQTDGTVFHQFRISNVDQMMAFDCGEFELK